MPIVSTPVLIAAARSGHVVSFPTDTVPALAVLPSLGTKIYALKQRPENKPLILMASTWTELQEFIAGDHPAWARVVQRYLPGALTLVLPANDRGQVLNHTDTIGVRIPRSPIALGILQQTGPLLTTSANLSGSPPLTTMATIADTFPSVFVLDRESRSQGRPSTVIKWIGNGWQVLRQGDVNFPTVDIHPILKDRDS